jgi:hypothetical protein
MVLGSYWVSGGITYFEEGKTFFELSPADKLLGFLHLGIPKASLPEENAGQLQTKVRLG